MMSNYLNTITAGLQKVLGQKSNAAHSGVSTGAETVVELVRQINDILVSTSSTLFFGGYVTAAVDTTHTTIGALIGLDDNFFYASQYYQIVIYTTDSAAPIGEAKAVTAFDGTLGKTTHGALSVACGVGDFCVIIHETLYETWLNTQYLSAVADGGTTYPTKVLDNSILGILMTKQSGGDISDFNNSTDSLEAIRDQIDTIPASGNAASWNATALTAIEGECEDALEAEYLDHYLQLDGATQKYPENAANDSILAKMLCKGDPATLSSYDCTTDSQEMLSDKLGAFTGDGGVAQDDSVKASLDLLHTDIDAILEDTGTTLDDLVDGVESELAKVPKSDSTVSWNATALQAIQDEVEDALEGENLDHLLATTDGATSTLNSSNVADGSIIAKLASKGANGATPEAFDCTTDSLEAIRDQVDTIPASGNAASWNATALAAIEGEVEDGLEGKMLDHLLAVTDGAASTVDPANVVDGSIIAKIISKGANGATPETFNCTTDSLEAIADAVGAIPTTAMRGTDNAFLASVGGALDTAATYAVAADKTLMAYIKGILASGIAVAGTVVDAAPSADDFDTSLTEATDNHYNWQTMLFLDGPLMGQTHEIEGYTGDTKNCNFSFFSDSGWTEAPANGNAFIILTHSNKSLAALIAILINRLGVFTGDGGSDQGDSVKADLDLINDMVDGIEAKTDLIMPGTKFATKTSTADLTSGDIFSYTGTVGIISIIGRITTAIENAAVTVKLTITPDALAAKDICAASADIKTFTVGTMLSITGTFADAMVVTTGVGCAVSQASMITATCVTSGKISTVFNPSADNSGVIVWEILWIPQTPGATLVAA